MSKDKKKEKHPNETKKQKTERIKEEKRRKGKK